MENLQPLLRRIKASAGGMLSIQVYERLYRLAEESSGGVFVEVGTAQGAATIALAMGAKSSGRPFHIYTADPFDRGSRLAVGSVADNVALVSQGFAEFGVTDDVTLVIGQSTELLEAIGGAAIALLLIDADGRIDRDLSTLYEHLSPGCPIIIDDVDGLVYVHRVARGWVVDQKHRLSHLLAHSFCKIGALAPVEVMGQTGFYRKGPTKLTSGDIVTSALASYRELVFTHLPRRQIGPYAFARRLVRKLVHAGVAIWRSKGRGAAN